MQTLMERLRWARAQARGEQLSQRELGRLAGIAESHVGRIEAQEKESNRLAWGTIQKLAAVFGVAPEWLAAGEGKEPRRRTVMIAIGRAREAARHEPKPLTADPDREATINGYEGGATEPAFTDSTPTNPEAA